jgi:osmoprotectant transport system ATP-binding protein
LILQAYGWIVGRTEDRGLGETAIAIRNVSKSYRGGARPALDGVTLDVAAGAFVVLIGASGSGKTSLLKLINRLAEPDAGSIAVFGEEIAAADPVRLRWRIGYVFQGVGLFPHLTVAENIGITPSLLGWDTRAIAARVEEMLDLVRLGRDFGPRLPATLSGGQAQRVGVARALAAKPRIMLMDEPFGAVDPIVRDALASDYRTLHDALGLTTILVTHDVTEALLLADTIAVLDQGRVIETGAPAALMADSRHAKVRELMAMPRRQAERIGAFAAGAGVP